MCQISADNNTKEDGFNEELLILKYNMNGKVHKQYQDMFQDVDNTIYWYLLLDSSLHRYSKQDKVFFQSLPL